MPSTPDSVKTLIPVSDQPLTILVHLPDGCDPGRFEAAAAFAELIRELRAQHVGKNFQLLPFGYKEGGLQTILAVAD